MDWKNRCNPFFISIWIFAIIVKTSSLARQLNPVYWDMTNSNFVPDGLTIEAEINDVIDIICPRTANDSNAQYHTFTKVTNESYVSCDLDAFLEPNERPKDKLLLQCNRPFDENKYTLLFQAWTPYPHGSIFEPGKDYYYITTASGSPDGLLARKGGLCDSHAMKLKVHIKEPTTTRPKVTAKPPSTTPRVHTTTRKAVKTKSPDPTDKPKLSTMAYSNRVDKQTGSANVCQMSSLLLLVSCLVARVRWQ